VQGGFAAVSTTQFVHTCTSAVEFSQLYICVLLRLRKEGRAFKSRKFFVAE